MTGVKCDCCNEFATTIRFLCESHSQVSPDENHLRRDSGQVRESEGGEENAISAPSDPYYLRVHKMQQAYSYKYDMRIVNEIDTDNEDVEFFELKKVNKK